MERLPSVLEPHRAYLDRANELAGSHPLVALQCRLMCLQLAMAARNERRDLTELAACELKQWILSTLKGCEAARAQLGAAAVDSGASLTALRALGLELIARATRPVESVLQLAWPDLAWPRLPGAGSSGPWLRHALGARLETAFGPLSGFGACRVARTKPPMRWPPTPRRTIRTGLTRTRRPRCPGRHM